MSTLAKEKQDKLRAWADAIAASISRVQEFDAVKIIKAGGSPWKLFEWVLREECEKRGIKYSPQRYRNAWIELRRLDGQVEEPEPADELEVPF